LLFAFVFFAFRDLGSAGLRFVSKFFLLPPRLNRPMRAPCRPIAWPRSAPARPIRFGRRLPCACTGSG